MALSLSLFSSLIPTEAHSHSLTASAKPLLHPPTRLPLLRAVTSATVSHSEGKVRGIMKPRKVSPEMQAIVGVPEIPRTQALKLIWAYIKDNNLQDSENKRVIKCDEKLKKVFAGRDQVEMLEIAGLISPHFLK